MSEFIESIAPKRPSSSHDISEKLSQWIDSGKLKVGALLPPERELSVQFKVSRGVVREATKKLEQRGLVVIRQGIGVRVVNNPSLPIQSSLYSSVPEERERLKQCGQARILIEPELAAFAAQRVTPEYLRKMEATQEALLHEPDIRKAALHDIEFHEIIAEMSGNKVLALMLSSVAELGRISREHTLREFGVRRAYDFHQKIIAAISAGDSVAARRAMRGHLGAALGDIS
jgi:GntR family transcriptional repressor for pyruvate dehydrogenase complex